MKNKYFILLSIFICVSCVAKQQFATNPQPDNTYKIKSIESNDVIYIIHAKNNGHNFKIISLKDTINSDFETIKVGNKYQLDLMKIFPNDLINRGLHRSRENAIDSCLVSIDKKTHFSLYVAQNLNGLNISNFRQSEETIIDRFSITSFVGGGGCNRGNCSFVQLFIRENIDSP